MVERELEPDDCREPLREPPRLPPRADDEGDRPLLSPLERRCVPELPSRLPLADLALELERLPPPLPVLRPPPAERSLPPLLSLAPERSLPTERSLPRELAPDRSPAREELDRVLLVLSDRPLPPDRSLLRDPPAERLPSLSLSRSVVFMVVALSCRRKGMLGRQRPALSSSGPSSIASVVPSLRERSPAPD